MRDELTNDPSSVTIDGFGEDTFIKKENLKDENGKPALCSFAKTRRNYQNQHWYMCFTCGLSGNEGICGLCAKTCHKGHEVVYCKLSSFFCDCQFKSNCKSLPDDFKEANSMQQQNDDDFGGFSYDRE
jgi:hypothetical protein